MQEFRISIIVPIYNTADYLPRCIESIRMQSYRNTEIILVDDGSTDHSLSICRKYAGMDKRIQIIEQENRGNNAARKAGLMASTGDYVTFVDSDDWIGSRLVERLQAAAERCSADMVISNVQMIYADGRKAERKNLIEAGIYKSPSKAVKNLFYYGRQSDYGIMPFIFAKLYRGNLLMDTMDKIGDQIQYDEDRALVWTCLMQNITAVFIDDMEYYYCQRKDGLVRSKDEMYLAKVNYFYRYMSHLFEKEDKILKEQLDHYVLRCIQTGLRWKLGLSENNLLRNKYVLDMSVLFKGVIRIILYGAGVVGRDYYESLKASQNINVCAWIDKAWEKLCAEGLEIKPVEQVCELEYDYLLVAVKNELVFQEIKSELTAYAVPADKIIWGRPCNVQL